MKPISRRRSGQRGFAMVAYAAMIVGVIGFTGLAVDVGYLQFEKRRIQSAADAAAMGALREMERGNTDLVAAGQNDSSLNGFTNGLDNTTVTINNPPTSGSYNGTTSAVQAIVQRTVPTFFMQVFGQKGVTISAQAVAQTSTTAGSIGGCIYVMALHGSGALNIHGTMNMETACGVVVNSDDPSAFTAVGNANILLDNNAKVGVVGPGNSGLGWSFSGGATLTDSKTSKSESPVNIVHFPDPLASVVTPTPTGPSPYTAPTMRASSGQTKIDKKSALTLSPGIYCGGLWIQSTNGTLTLGSGIYILAGGGLTVDATANVQTAAGGVMFYNTSSSSASWGCSGNYPADNVTINGGSTLNLAGLTTTSPVGVLFFDDRSITGLSHKINGTSGNTFDGSLYFLNAALNFIGTSSTGGYLVMVSNTLDIGGTSQLGNDYTSLTNVYTIAPAATGGGLVQ